MTSILIGSVLISLLHALIPNHWLPVFAAAKKERWDQKRTNRVALMAGIAHVISTIFLGMLVGLIGFKLKVLTEQFTKLIVPIFLVTVGFYFILQFYNRKFFHAGEPQLEGKSNPRIIWLMVFAMFLSPCMEIEVYFLLAGAINAKMMLVVAGIYALISLSGTLIWTKLAYRRVTKMNWAFLERNAGIIVGVVLVMTGVVNFLIY